MGADMAGWCAQGGNRSGAGWAVLAGAALVASSALAQGGGEVEEVVVTGARLEQSLPQELADFGNRLTVVTGQQIDNGGFNDLAQVLQSLVPGLYVSPKNGAFDYVDVSLQGSRTNEILWLVDGVRISNRLYNSVTPFDTIPAHMIERIEVLEGGQGLFYGTQSVSGVVNVITKGFTDRAAGRLAAALDSNDGEHISAFYRTGAGPNRFVVFGSSDSADGYEPFPAADFQPSVTERKRGYDVKNIGVKFAHDFGEGLRLNVGYQKIDGKLDYEYPSGVQDAFNERDEDIFTATVDVSPSENLTFYVKSYFHQWDSYWSEYDVVLGPPVSYEQVSNREFWGFKDYGVNALAQISSARNVDYFVGYDFQSYGGRDDVLLIAPNEERVHALFGQIRTTPELSERARAAFGVRRNMPSVSQSKSIWNLSGQFDVSSSFYLRAAVGTSFRLPDAYELFAIDLNCCVGNPNLRPESSENLNASVGGAFGASGIARWELIYFQRDVEDLIVDVDDGTGSGNTIAENVAGKTRVRGHQVVLGVAPSASFSAQLSYTYNDSESLNQTSGGYDSIPGIPRDQTAVSLDYAPEGRPFGLMLTVNDVGNVYDVVGGVGRVERGNYTVVDLSGRIYLDAGRRQQIALRLENAFDEDYVTRNTRGRVDFSDPAQFYAARNLGTPRTVHLSYEYSF
jgi:vitamin B12 transporter